MLKYMGLFYIFWKQYLILFQYFISFIISVIFISLTVFYYFLNSLNYHKKFKINSGNKIMLKIYSIFLSKQNF